MITVPHSKEMMAPLSDEELVSNILAGDTGAFELLMRRHNQRLFRIARAVVRDSTEAEDVVQESYVRAFTALAGFQARSSVATWLSRITLHEALRCRRRRRHARERELRYMEGLPDTAAGPPDPVDRDESRSALVAALDSLPAAHRAVVMLRLVEGLSTRETAACLRMTEANVKVSLHRARRILAESIQRRALADLRAQFSFDGDRCDRIVAGVFARLHTPRP